MLIYLIFVISSSKKRINSINLTYSGMLKIHRLILTVIVMALCIVPAAAFVERSVTSPDADGITTVTLSFSEGAIGGITEEIPAGFEFASTEHPANQTLVDGNRVHFAVIGEEKVVYSLKATGDIEGNPNEITGTWIDLRSEGNETAVTNNQAPGFGIISGFLAITCIAFLRRRKQ